MESNKVQSELIVKTQRNDVLKLLAMITMLIDHVGEVFFPRVLTLRVIGRLALPIFAYQIAIGYSKTSNLKNYVKRLLVFALISQIPFCLVFSRPWYTLNIIFAFLLSILVLYVYDKGITYVSNYRKEKNNKNLLLAVVTFIGLVLIIIMPEVLTMMTHHAIIECSYYTSLMVLLFYILHDKKSYMAIGYIILSVLQIQILGAYKISHSLKVSPIECLFRFKEIWQVVSSKFYIYTLQANSIFALIAIYVLESIKPKFKLNKYIGYWFYPVHLVVLMAINWIIN